MDEPRSNEGSKLRRFDGDRVKLVTRNRPEMISWRMLKSDATDPLTREIIGAAIEVHRQVGPGLLESAYHACMRLELRGRGIPFRSEVPAGLEYKGQIVDPQAYRVDLLVSDCVVVELKAVEALGPVHTAQVLTYLRLLRLRVGLLINFNVPVLRQGLHRIFNNS